MQLSLSQVKSADRSSAKSYSRKFLINIYRFLKLFCLTAHEICQFVIFYINIYGFVVVVVVDLCKVLQLMPEHSLTALLRSSANIVSAQHVKTSLCNKFLGDFIVIGNI